MQPDQRLIKRFQEGKCTPDEARLVMDWLLRNETLSDSDWGSASTVGGYSAGVENEMLGFIVANKPEEQARNGGWGVTIRRLPWKQVAAAACVLLVVGLVMRTGRRTASSDTAKQVTLPNSAVTIAANAGHSVTVRMKDGSMAVLEPGSVLHYDSVGYNRQDRTIMLEGQAIFTVAPVKDRPFSVNARGYSTTALGTSFLVSTRNDFLVRLFSGKVMVRQLNTTATPVYLKPGEQLASDLHKNELVLSEWESQSRSEPGRGMHYSGDTLVFDHAPLPDVLEVLHKRYRIPIQYQRKTICNTYFTGQVLPGDAIELILKTVTRINDLSLIAADDGFVIK